MTENNNERLIIREFRKEDAKDVAEIFHLTENDDRPPEAYERWLSYPWYCVNLVAELNDKVVGRVLLDQLYDFYNEIVNFAVHPDYQGLGIGSQMIATSIKRIESRELAIPFLKMSQDNTRARHVYQKYGLLPAVIGNETLNDWMLKYEALLLTKTWLSRHSNASFQAPTITEQEFQDREIRFTQWKQERMIQLIKQLRLNQFSSYTNESKKEKLIFTITGHPDQIIGFIGEEYCVPSLPPSISGISLDTEEKPKFKVQLMVVEERGEAVLTIENHASNPIRMNFRIFPFPGIRISSPFGTNETSTIEIKENSTKQVPFEIFLDEDFNHRIFSYSSFEAVPLSIRLDENSGTLGAFHVTQFFWYRLLQQ